MGVASSSEIEIFGEGELEAEFKRRGGADSASIKELVSTSYNSVLNTIIRPKRAVYRLQDLGPLEFALPNSDSSAQDAHNIVQREDFEVENDRELLVRCSHWRVCTRNQAGALEALVLPCLIYLHSNTGSRCDALRVRDHALARGFSVLAFDFSGSGLSDGVYITGGWNEATDLQRVLEHVEQDPTVSAVCLYAHSMGTYPAIVNTASRTLWLVPGLEDARAALPSSFQRPSQRIQLEKPIKGMVLDGAYTEMAQVIQDLMVSIQQEGFGVPLSLLKLATNIVLQRVQERTEVDMKQLQPIRLVDACFVPALLLTGEDDKYVRSTHSDELASRYTGPALVMRVEGEHYTERKPETYAQAIDFLLGAARSVEMTD